MCACLLATHASAFQFPKFWCCHLSCFRGSFGLAFLKDPLLSFSEVSGGSSSCSHPVPHLLNLTTSQLPIRTQLSYCLSISPFILGVLFCAAIALTSFHYNYHFMSLSLLVCEVIHLKAVYYLSYYLWHLQEARNIIGARKYLLSEWMSMDFRIMKKRHFTWYSLSWRNYTDLEFSCSATWFLKPRKKINWTWVCLFVFKKR